MCVVEGRSACQSAQQAEELTNLYKKGVSKGNMFYNSVVSIEFSPLSTVELTTNWYHLHNGDYQVIIRTQLW